MVVESCGIDGSEGVNRFVGVKEDQKQEEEVKDGENASIVDSFLLKKMKEKNKQR